MGGVYGLELRGQLIAECHDETALENGPAGESRGAVLLRPSA